MSIGISIMIADESDAVFLANRTRQARTLARSADHGARGLGLCARRVDELVRAARGGLRAGPGAQPAAGSAVGSGTGGGQGRAEASGAPVRRFEELTYQTLESWSRSRRVVGKAEYLLGKANPRFVVTSYAVERLAAAPELFSCFAEPPMGSLKPQKALASGGNSHKHANNRR